MQLLHRHFDWIAPSISKLHAHQNRLFTLILLFVSFCIFSNAQAATQNDSLPVCAYIASYAPGYDWQDDLEHALAQTLNKRCEIRVHYMDSKRVQDPDQLKEMGIKAKQFIELHNPALVIVSDDNAVNYVLKQHFKNSEIPFVFCGLNTSSKIYGLPYDNTTGMIEVSPIKKLIAETSKLTITTGKIAYLLAPGLTELKNAQEFSQATVDLGFKPYVVFAQTEQIWREQYMRLQKDPEIDMIVVGNFNSLPTWDSTKNRQLVRDVNRKLTLSTLKTNMDYAVIGMTKRPEEQGEWAGLAAIELLNGRAIKEIEIVPNRHFDLWINSEMIAPHKQELPVNLLKQAKLFVPENFRSDLIKSGIPY